jgi:hypothetical protein
VERRQELRWEAGEDVVLTILGEAGGKLAAKVVNISGNGLCLEVDRTIGTGALVRVDFADALLLGEVVYCRPVSGNTQIGVKLEHALHHMQDLQALSDNLLGALNCARTSRRCNTI